MIKVHTILPGRLFQRGHLLDKSPTEKLDFLRQHDIRIVVGLACQEDLDLRSMLASQYIWVPIPDGKIKDPSVINDIVTRVCSYEFDRGGGVLCYCRAGRNRSGLMNAMLLTKFIGCSGREAIDIVRKNRPNALANDHFVSFLEQIPSIL